MRDLPWCWSNQRTSIAVTVSGCFPYPGYNLRLGVSYLERVLVQHIERVARELDTTVAVTLDQISVLVTCTDFLSQPAVHGQTGSLQLEIEVASEIRLLTGELPNEVAGNVRSFGGHCECLSGVEGY